MHQLHKTTCGGRLASYKILFNVIISPSDVADALAWINLLLLHTWQQIHNIPIFGPGAKMLNAVNASQFLMNKKRKKKI